MTVYIGYPASYTPDEDSTMISFKDIPSALTSVADDEETFIQAEDCLSEALHAYLDNSETIPSPSKKDRDADDEYMIYSDIPLHTAKMHNKKLKRKAHASMFYTPEPDVEFADIRELKASRGRMGDHSGWTGTELRAIRRVNGTGRPV